MKRTSSQTATPARLSKAAHRRQLNEMQDRLKGMSVEELIGFCEQMQDILDYAWGQYHRKKTTPGLSFGPEFRDTPWHFDTSGFSVKDFRQLADQLDEDVRRARDAAVRLEMAEHYSRIGKS